MKNKKLLSLLVLGLMVTGCDVEALPNDYEETYGAIKMEDVYDTVRNGQGEAALYNNLINLIAEKEITAAGRLNELYARIDKKIEDLIEDQYTKVVYENYKFNSDPTTGVTNPEDDSQWLEVEEDKLLAYYKSQGYKIENTEDATATGSTSKCWNAKEVLTNDKITNTYVSEVLKNEVLTAMLNEQFIYEKKASSLYKTKQLRQLEYVYVDFDKDNDDYTKITDYDAKLMDGTITDLEQIANEWKFEKKSTILENAKKAGTSEDEDGKYYSEFSSCGGNVNKCANEKMYAVDETEYYNEPQIYTNTESPLLASMTDTLFSSTFKVTDDMNDKNDNVYKVDTNDDGKADYYYLTSQSDIDLGVESLINVDTNTNKYYFVRFVVVDNFNPKLEGNTYNPQLTTLYGENQKVEYAIAQTLASTASNYSNSIIHYLNKYSIAINDDKFFDYVFETYGYPEVDE